MEGKKIDHEILPRVEDTEVGNHHAVPQGNPERFQVVHRDIFEWDGTNLITTQRKKTDEEKTREVLVGTMYAAFVPPLMAIVSVCAPFGIGWKGSQPSIAEKMLGVGTIGALVSSNYFKPVRYATLGAWALATVGFMGSAAGQQLHDNYKRDNTDPDPYEGKPRFTSAQEAAAYREVPLEVRESKSFRDRLYEEQLNRGEIRGTWR
jgi:hypothetical protein